LKEALLKDEHAHSWSVIDHIDAEICLEREFFIDYLLVRIHFIIVMIRRAGLAPQEFELHATPQEALSKDEHAHSWSVIDHIGTEVCLNPTSNTLGSLNATGLITSERYPPEALSKDEHAHSWSVTDHIDTQVKPYIQHRRKER